MTTCISNVLGIHRMPHSKLDFVNVRLSPDTKLFLDPCLIAQGQDEWSMKAGKTINSYFDRFYSLYRNNASDFEKLALFQHAHEINATHLGYGNGNNGKAKTPMGMLITFSGIPSLMRQGIPLAKVTDLPLFIDDFAEDCLSDMLTNILFKNLMDFTLEKCEQYGVETSDAPGGWFFWDAESGNWKEYVGPCLLHNGKLVLIVPKNVVRNRYYFNAENFFRRVILTRLQQESSWVDSNGKIQMFSKKDLLKKTKGNSTTLDCVSNLTEVEPSYLREYHAKLPEFYEDRGMSDEDLDRIVYG